MIGVGISTNGGSWIVNLVPTVYFLGCIDKKEKFTKRSFVKSYLDYTVGVH